jgi:hypothetical protein
MAEKLANPPFTTVTIVQIFGIFSLGAVGLLIAYFGVPWLARAGNALPFNPAFLGLIAEALAYGIILSACWIFAVRPTPVGWASVGVRRCDWSLLVNGAFLAFIWVVASSTLYSLAGLWDAGLAYGSAFVAPYRSDPFNLAALFLLAGPLTALVEEMLFRGILYGWLRRRLNTPLAAIVSALLFTVCHPSVFAAGTVAVIDTTLLAILLALLFEARRSLWPGILCHALYNMLLLSLYLYQG